MHELIYNIHIFKGNKFNLQNLATQCYVFAQFNLVWFYMHELIYNIHIFKGNKFNLQNLATQCYVFAQFNLVWFYMQELIYKIHIFKGYKFNLRNLATQCYRSLTNWSTEIHDTDHLNNPSSYNTLLSPKISRSTIFFKDWNILKSNMGTGHNLYNTYLTI